MQKIALRKYKNINKYKGKNPSYNEEMLNISMADLKRYAVTLGDFSNYHVSPKGKNFYQYLLEMSLQEYNNGVDDCFKIGDDYSHAESSIKTCISFFMGMITTKAVAEKKYNISQLIHLTDNIISEIKPKGEHPDFFGVKKEKGFLFEAKGTGSLRPKFETMEHATTQLGNIKCVSLEKSTGSKEYRNLKGYAVASGFSKNILIYHCIDPSPSGEIKIKIDWDKATIFYYQHIMNLLLQNRIFQDSNIPHFLLVEYGQYKIGIDENIFNVLEKYKSVYNGSMNIAMLDQYLEEDCKYISTYLREFECLVSTEEMSLGLDGIICTQSK